MCHQIILFSQFIEKEICTAKNIKNRTNRHKVVHTLSKILEFTKLAKYENGLFIFAGFDEYDDFIFETIEPKVKSDLFIYDCSNRFKIDFVEKFMETYDGSIIFANGNECIIYNWMSRFVKKKHINANLIKRHKKGGQSSLRFSRLADESRVHYVTHIIDNLNDIKSKNNYIFGSDEILRMIMDRKDEINVNLINGGFYNFDQTSINNTEYWLKYFRHETLNDDIFEKILYYLETDPDHLDFNIESRELMDKYILNINDISTSDKKISLSKSSKYYAQLIQFDYIGIKYFSYDDHVTFPDGHVDLEN